MVLLALFILIMIGMMYRLLTFFYAMLSIGVFSVMGTMFDVILGMISPLFMFIAIVIMSFMLVFKDIMILFAVNILVILW